MYTKLCTLSFKWQCYDMLNGNWSDINVLQTWTGKGS